MSVCSRKQVDTARRRKQSRWKLPLLLQAIHAINAALGGQLAHTADALLGGAAASGAGGEVHLAFGVLVH